MKRFFSMLIVICLVGLMIPAWAENDDLLLSDVVGTDDWLIPRKDGYMAKWEEDDTLVLYLFWGRGNSILYYQKGPHVYTDSMDLNTYITATENGWIIRSEFKQNPKTEAEFYMVPLVITEERYGELTGHMSLKDKKRFNSYLKFSYGTFHGKYAERMLAAFPKLATEDLYILKSAVPGNGVITGSALASLEQMLADYGYTEEDFEQDMANVAIWPTDIVIHGGNFAFQGVASDSSLTRSKALQLAKLCETINECIVVDYIYTDGEPVSIEDLIMETYQVDDAIWHVTLGCVNEDGDKTILTVIAIPE